MAKGESAKKNVKKKAAKTLKEKKLDNSHGFAMIVNVHSDDG